MHLSTGFLVLLTALCHVDSLNVNTKLVLIWGSPNDTEISETYSGSWDECLQKCYCDVTCVVIFRTSAGGEIYKIGTPFSVQKIIGAGGNIVGIKRTQEGCSGTFPRPMFGQTTVTESFTSEKIVYNYTISEIENDDLTEWKFDFKYFVQCDEESFASIRGDIAVCISIRTFSGPFCQNRAAGVALCTEGNGLVITGAYAYAEGYTIGDYLTKKSNSALLPTRYSNMYFWIDGIRSSSAQYNMSDPTLNGITCFNWGPNSQEGVLNTCAFIEGTSIVRYWDCDATENGNSYCLRGAVCRIKPVSHT
ncbi:PAN-3 domain-containing protein [Caenorhabditis elegans]|uniref:PAN-3 domain-containing protein n=1 Tax=Caenorhabditis elegans TaxID=6239 RepID=Q9NA50_CAEEL|nr:PAN-3 domain-containing protein [Caenorhabditis elegans]CAB60550.1 PAN-3 domain-containing protein [Caenorhabditis elegans]|eukprot:NP_502857.1 Uncharacterized protein CELE_Y73F8A.22 [Caenorhabditis elegans]